MEVLSKAIVCMRVLRMVIGEPQPMLGAVRLDGSTACMAVEGATNTEVFRAFVSEILLPELRPEDIVIRDNLSAHKSEPTIELICQAGAEVLFLPPYSPDLNPIEKMWSKIKNSLRSSSARNYPNLIDAIALAFNKVNTQDTIGWFTSFGYNII